MKTLLKLFLVLATFFAVTFVVIKLTDVITVEDIKAWLQTASSLSPIYIGMIVAGLLFADLFIAIPTLTICILSGYFLGFELGAAFNTLGVAMAGISGYLLSRYVGRGVLIKIVRDPVKIQEMENSFNKHGVAMVLLSRALPILPETSACLAGFTKMSMWKFLFAWFASSVPYVTIAAYAGSVSTLDSPQPAIFTAIFLSIFLWVMWVIFIRKNRTVMNT